MKPITITTTQDRFLVSIDKNAIDKETLLELLERIRIEHLASKLDVDEDIDALGEEIKADWWEKHKAQFLKEEE